MVLCVRACERVCVMFPYTAAQDKAPVSIRNRSAFQNALRLRIKYSRTSMARTSLGPWKFVRDMGSSNHNHGTSSGSK